MLPHIKQFYLPEISYYVQGRDSPYFTDRKVISELKTWFKDMVAPNKLDMVVEAGISITSKFAPDCIDKKKFISMSKFVIFGYIFDDIEPLQESENEYKSEGTEKTPVKGGKSEAFNKLEVFSQVADVVAGKRRAETSLEKVVDSIYCELKTTCSPEPYKRHVYGFTSWAETMQLEHSLQRKNEMDLEQFLEFRKDNGGFYGMTAILECLMDFDVAPIWKICLPIYQDVYTHLMFVNDIYSFRKEYFDNDATNVLIFLMLNYSFTIDQSVEKVVGMLKSLEASIKKRIYKVLKIYKEDALYPQIYEYVTALELMTAGNLLHSQTVRRYHGTTKKIGSGILIMDKDETIIVDPVEPVTKHQTSDFLQGLQLNPSRV